MAYIMPVVIIVMSNIMYQICAKGTPHGINPLASLTVTYLVGAVACGGLYFLTSKSPDLIREYRHLNWAPFVLGLVIVGLEAGYLYAYKAGWSVSKLPVFQSTILAIILIFVGYLLYHEEITPNKVIGICICLVGLFFINKK